VVRPRAPQTSAKQRQAAAQNLSGHLDQAAAVPIENAAALVPFFERLWRLQHGETPGPLRILHYGDSHTASDDWPGTLRLMFQQQFGDGGSGYTLAGRPWRGFRRLDLRSGESRGWRTEGVGRNPGDGLNGLGGVSLVAEKAGEWITLEAECDRLEIYYWQQTGGGALQLIDNGIAVDTIPTSGPEGPGFAEYEAGPGFHRFELRTLDRGPVRLFGWVAEKPAGVTYETLGINGAQASIILHWDEQLLASHILRRDPALIVLAYGTNEASNRSWNLENYREMFTNLLRRLRRAAPAASLLVIGPPDRFYRSRGRWLPYQRFDHIIAAGRAAALSEGGAFLDLREKMGGQGSMRDWVLSGLAQYDHVHFTTNGYRKLAALLFQDLNAQYTLYTEVRGKLADTANGQPRTNP
jgi:lysophospholipase L1-like esterase